MKSFFLPILLLALLLPLLASCSLFDTRCEESGTCDDGFSDRVRVIPERGVDGVEFGDSIEDVYEKLGTPSTGLGWADGLYRSWRVLFYDKGPHDGLWINFLIEDDGATPGPVDVLLLRPSYRGTTSDGIGIGSRREEVERAYGEPDSVGPSRNTYCFGEKHLTLSIEADTVASMSIGYWIPMPDGHASSCQ